MLGHVRCHMVSPFSKVTRHLWSLVGCDLNRRHIPRRLWASATYRQVPPGDHAFFRSFFMFCPTDNKMTAKECTIRLFSTTQDKGTSPFNSTEFFLRFSPPAHPLEAHRIPRSHKHESQSAITASSLTKRLYTMNRGGGAGGGRGGGAAGGGAAPGAGARTPFNIQGPKFQANGRIRGMTDFQQKKWLERSSVWPDMAANGYIGRKVLGAGAHAIVGVWENTQPLANLPKHVVVKQVSDQQHQTWEALRVESKLLRDILRTNTEHIIKLYKSAYRAGGTGTSAARDPLPFVPGQPWDPTLEVGRMYLEYCPEGDLNSQFENVISAGEDIPEEFIWRFLHCLASALIVLEKGMQDPTPNGPPIAGWAPITHFDIKPDNSTVAPHQYA